MTAETAIHEKRPGETGAVAVLVGGGPAPGINGVISAVVMEGRRLGYRMLGVQDGFRWLAEGRLEQARELRTADVLGIHTRGGSILGTSRFDPTRNALTMDAVLDSFQRLGVDRLVTIGGDGTVNTARRLEKASQGKLRVAHVPKTIDNDLPLPEHAPTFGFQTARHEGVRLLRYLMEEARTTDRWCVVVTMGREAGHLALGIGKAAGATLTVLGEEFRPRTPLSILCDVVESSILKCRATGRTHGAIVLAEGVSSRIDAPEWTAPAEELRLRLSEVPLGLKTREEIVRRFEARGDSVGMIVKSIGYELRCADPIPFDLEYTRDLGYGAMQFLHHGGSGALISIQGGKLVPIPFEAVLDVATGRTRVRFVDLSTESYQVARQYMIRLAPRDFEDADLLGRMAQAARTTPKGFRERFEYLVRDNAWLYPVRLEGSILGTSDPGVSRASVSMPL